MDATDALAIALRVEHTFARCYALSDIATYLIALNRWDEAAKHAYESLGSLVKTIGTSWRCGTYFISP